MNDEARDVLREIVRTEGPEIGGEGRRLGALLADRCGTLKLEINLLVSAADDGVPAALLRSSETTPRGATVERLARELEESRGFEYSRARWAVESWASALGVDAGAPLVDPVPAGGGGGDPTHELRTDPETERRPLGGGGARPAGGGGGLGGGLGGGPTPGPGPSPNRTKLLVGGGVVVVVIIIAALLFGGGDDGGEEVQSGTTTSTAVATTSTVPATTTTTRGGTTTTSGGGGVGTVEQQLLNRVPNTGTTAFRSTCKALAETDKRGDFRGIPAIYCEPTAALTVYYYQLPNPNVMNDEFADIVSSNTIPTGVCNPSENATFKGNTTYTSGSSNRGKILCYVDRDSNARLEFTDDALNVYAAVVATDNSANRQQIYQFWRDRGTLMR